MLYIGFPIISLIYIVIFLVIYYSKKRINLFENKIVISLMILNVVGLLFELGCYVVMAFLGIQDTLIGMFILKSYVAYIAAFNWLLTGYIFVLTNSKRKNPDYNIKKYFWKVMAIFSPFLAISIVSYVAPLEYFSEYPKFYTYGFATDLISYSMIILLPLWLIKCIVSVIVNKRNNRKYHLFIVLFGILLIGTSGAMSHVIDNSILLITAAESIMIVMIYLTIENPDMKMVEELELAKEEADKANRSKTDFLSSMSHEIRTPLNAIVGFSDCILDAKELDEAQENAKDIINASHTLLEIVNGILDISKIESGKLEIIFSKYDARDTFVELAKLITPRMNEKGLNFSYFISPELPATLYGDQANVKKIVTNLLSNACKYTDRGFVRYEVNCVNMGEYSRLIISVEDSGRGIQKGSVEKMFTKFQRLDEDKNTTIEGTGLGLSITKQLTELMGGKIFARTTYGVGSKFTIVLNQRIEKKEASEVKEVNSTVDLTDVEIMIVDDAPLNLKVAAKLFEKYHANKLTLCDSGFECIDKLKTGHEFDLIFLDDMMPKMSGVETFKKIQADFAGFHTPVVALTANAISGMREKYISEGFNDYISKPIDQLELIRVCNELLGRKEASFEIINKNENENTMSPDVLSEKNRVIPVEDNIEEMLGDRLDLTKKEDNYQSNPIIVGTVPVDGSDDVIISSPAMPNINIDSVADLEPVASIDLVAPIAPVGGAAVETTPQVAPVAAAPAVVQTPVVQATPQVAPVTPAVVQTPVVEAVPQVAPVAAAPVVESTPQLTPIVDNNVSVSVPVAEAASVTPPAPTGDANETYDRSYLEKNGANIESALGLLGDMEMYNMTICDFLQEVDDKWKRINDNLAAGNMPDYSIDVHSLKSDCKYLGFLTLADISYDHELKSKENQLDYIKEHFPELEKEYSRVLEVVKKYVEHNPVTEE